MKSARFVALLFAIVFVIGLFAACDTADHDTLQSAEVSYPQGDPNIANEKYNTLLVHWAFDKNFPNDVYADFPEFYGGAYIGTHGNLVILLTERNDDTIGYFEELIGLDNVVFEEAEYSYGMLVEEKDAAVAAIAGVNERYHRAVSSVGISVPDNAINLYLNMTVVEEHDLDIQQICAALTSFPNIRVMEVSGYDEPA